MTIQLACISDGRFARHTGAMLQSVLRCTAPDRCEVHVLHDGSIADADAARLATVASVHGCDLHLVHVDDDRLAACSDGYFPRAVWFRILLPDLLPDADRVIYLDSDLVAADSLSPLWQTEIGESLLGAVTNPLYPFMPAHYRELGIDRPEDYFNSGVLLMDLARMRAARTADELAEYARAHPHLGWPDQDALNAVCKGRWFSLHPRWNVQSTLYELQPAELPFTAQLVEEARAHPALVHFIGPWKPWHYPCRHPLRSLYFDSARETPWGAPEIEGRTARNMLLRRLPLVWVDRWFRTERRLRQRRDRRRRT